MLGDLISLFAEDAAARLLRRWKGALLAAVVALALLALLLVAD